MIILALCTPNNKKKHVSLDIYTYVGCIVLYRKQSYVCSQNSSTKAIVGVNNEKLWGVSGIYPSPSLELTASLIILMCSYTYLGVGMHCHGTGPPTSIYRCADVTRLHTYTPFATLCKQTFPLFQ